MDQVESFDLIIIGSGYAGINALNSACYHLPRKARVLVVGRESGWGGQFRDNYDYVRLHQAYRTFSVGGRKWGIKKKWGHLATKAEILEYFGKACSEAVEEKDISLKCLFEYEFVNHTVDTKLGKVHITAEPIKKDKFLPVINAEGEKLIIGTGYDVQLKKPFQFSTHRRLNLLTPMDILSPETDVKMQFSVDKTKPIYVVGSGKTAIDAMMSLHKYLPNADISTRLNCIAGSGTWFFNRDKLDHTNFWERNVYGNNTNMDWFLELLSKYDTTNASETLSDLGNKGFMHSPIDNPQSFVGAICSEKEVATIKNILSPSKEKVIKGYIQDVVDGEEGMVELVLRSIDGQHEFKKAIPEGSFIVNCTDHFSPLQHYPIVSADGLVLRPQNVCGFSSLSANYLTHLWFLGKLDAMWKDLPRPDVDLSVKARFGLDLFVFVLLQSHAMSKQLPPDIKSKYMNRESNLPLHRLIPSGINFMRNVDKLSEEKLKLYPKRFTDPSVPAKAPIYKSKY